MGLICCCQIIEIIPQEFKVIPLAACGYGESEMSNIGFQHALAIIARVFETEAVRQVLHSKG